MSAALPANPVPDLNQDLLANTVINGMILQTIAAGGGGGGGGAVTIADGADVTQGSTTDTEKTADGYSTASVISLLKGIQAYYDPSAGGPGNSVFSGIINADLGDNIPAINGSLSDIDGTTQNILNIMPATQPSQNSGAIDAGTLRVVQASYAFTPHFISVAASTSSTIPANALTWSYVLLTGAGTIGGVAAPLNVPVSGGALGSTLAYTTGTVSTAFVAYQT